MFPVFGTIVAYYVQKRGTPPSKQPSKTKNVTQRAPPNNIKIAGGASEEIFK
jgi:hypothetical protein